MEEIIVALPAYREVPGRAVSGGILYLHEKWDLVSSGKTVFVRVEAGDSKDRYFIWGLFSEITTNRMIYVYSNHLPHSAQGTLADRVAGMEQMATHAANRQQQTAPVILTGDFNSTPDIDTMRTLTGEIGTLPIQFIYAFEDTAVSGVSYGIDHILALPGTTVVESGVAADIWDSGSDHPAVFAVMEPWFGNLSGYPDGSVRMEATDPTATEEGETTATFSAIREGDTSSSLSVNFSVSGTATEGADFALSASSPVTIPAGQSSIEIIVTPIDDNVYGERSETLTLAITPGTGYAEISAPATATIEDNDNHVPVVNAGVDKQVILGEATWSPTSLTTTLWLDANDASTITESGGSVSQWADKNGNGKHAAQNTGANQPATGGDINGLNAIQFDSDGDADHLTTNLEQLTTVSMYLVLDPTAVGNNKYIAAIGASANGYKDPVSGLFWPLEEYADSSPRNKVWYGKDSLPNNVFANGVENANHNFQPVILSHQGTDLPTVNLNYLIGNRAESLNTLFDYKGLMGEIIICPEAHDLATRQKMEGYLAHKWGLTANLPDGHPYQDFAPLISVTLTDASVSDEDAGDPLTQSWELISKPAGAPDPTFSSITAIRPTVTFTAAGTYQLRLTASDGYASHSDDVIINIYSQQYGVWADSDFAQAFTDIRIDADPDGDGLVTLLEFAFGTDPTVSSGSALATDGSTHGPPKLAAPEGAGMELFFVRRKDHGTTGSVTYSVEFSGDLTSFFANAVAPTFVANSSSSADYEVVKVPFPAALPDTKEARFGRIAIEPTPDTAQP